MVAGTDTTPRMIVPSDDDVSELLWLRSKVCPATAAVVMVEESCWGCDVGRAALTLTPQEEQLVLNAAWDYNTLLELQ